ncbi:uncharacterized protein LOC135497105 [Lineus longissimus]|uniref:uncharacterized protein LOC135497105 n=1 Tax=Lineus longissimus TaxID=88925 RepID=UPI00315D5D81
MLHIPPEGTNDSPAEKTVNTTILTSSKGDWRDRGRDLQTCFPLVPVIVSKNGITVRTVALLDSASEITVIQSSLAEQLNLKGRSVPLTLKTLGPDVTKTSRIVSFQVKSVDDPDAKPLSVVDARILDIASFETPPQKIQPEWEHLSHLPLRDIDASDVKLLIGANVPEAHITNEVVIGNKHQPYGTRSQLGWSIIGLTEKSKVDRVSKKILCTLKKDDQLLESVERFWNTESFGTTCSESEPMSLQDRAAAKQLKEKTSLLENGHYEVPMLWKSDELTLPNNFAVAMRRYNSLERRLHRDPECKRMYMKTMEGYISKGHAVKLTQEDKAKSFERTWYIPHHGVTNPNKPGKVRVVFDAASEFQGQSLNDSLLTGPDLLNNLFGVLQRFRLYRVAVVGDIEGMFHQVYVPRSDADSLRFLWKEDPTSPGPPDTSMMVVHIFGSKDSPTCCNYALRRTAEDNINAFSKMVIQAYLKDYYMDDLVSSIQSVTVAMSFVDEVIELGKRGGWRVHKFISNSKEVMQHIPETERAIQPPGPIEFGRVQRALGVGWDVGKAFLRYTLEGGRIVCSFLAAKTRVAPIKPQLSIPRLELQGAVLAVRLAETLMRELQPINITRRIFWTDSTTVLAYIRNESKRFKPFIGNRVAEIREFTQFEEWRYIPTAQNPADYCSRGMKADDLTMEHAWFTGPTFLSKDEQDWPEQVIPNSQLKPDDPEVRKAATASVLLIGEKSEKFIYRYEFEIASLVKVDYFSTWRGLVRRTAWILRAYRNFASKLPRLGVKAITSSEITAEEWEDAEHLWIQHAQREAYPEAWRELKEDGMLSPKHPLSPLQPFHDGIHLRVGGRLRKADINQEAKHQLLLPRNRLTKLLLQDIHSSQAHCGREQLIAETRQKYWPLQGRTTARSVIKDCITCRRKRLKPVQPMMADLPTCRLNAAAGAFYHTGIDYFGPIVVTQRRSSVKRWGCLFTCMSVRAVHLELADSLSTDDFLLCLRRFIGMRSQPRRIFSDNGTNFVGANTELRRCLQQLDHDKILQYVTPLKIEWYFNPPTAPHFGGAWERLVRSVKKALSTVIANVQVSEAVLRTALVEVQAIVNNRPLTYASEDVNDFEALTPNHFIFGRAAEGLSPCRDDDRDINSRQRWKRVQVVANRVNQRWLKEYLPTLTLRSKWRRDGEIVAAGDLVTLVDDKLPRGSWTLARVIQVYPGDDGIIRTVKVKTADGTYVRPANKVCILEESARTESKWPENLGKKALYLRAKFW